MRTTIPPQSQGAQADTSRRSLALFVRGRMRASLLVLAASAVVLGPLGIRPVDAQAGDAASAPAPAHKPAVHPHKRASAIHPEAAPPPLTTPALAPPPAPEIPKWPVNQTPDAASVTWDSQGLRINAANSSLQQILKDISTATGAKVEGMGSDERIFGAYGPGRARDVLSQLLEGSGYNVMMIGDQGQGTPRQIVLSARKGGPDPAGATPAVAAVDDDAEVDEQPQPEQRQPGAPPFRPGFAPNGPPRTPGQVMQERQQQGQPQQLPNQPNTPPNQ